MSGIAMRIGFEFEKHLTEDKSVQVNLHEPFNHSEIIAMDSAASGSQCGLEPTALLARS